ncbi:MAG: hypothetical protein A4E66_00227 [Syntrophus sp. PtaB.Bin001]|nr:MAG: hypothetical protein A4E66_00227 [Syntrophus sp. PtaB.Bin001]
MTKPGSPPTNSEVAEWLGGEAFEYWKRLANFIDRHYPGVFTPEWLFGGRKHGWSLRYKKSKSFCTFVPEKNRFALLIVFGAAEREKVESIRDSLSAEIRKQYDAAHTYHYGKWLLITVDSGTVAADVQLLLAVKRKPKV